jgi:predicted ABC-type ATPase
MTRPQLTILGGPNGAGKTTLARSNFAELLKNRRFLNADDFAAEISPNDPGNEAVAAGRRLIGLRRKWIGQKIAFVIETTLATRTLLHDIQHAQAVGYHISLIFLWISDPDICIQRVSDRVSHGGHYIASEIIKRRHATGLRYLPQYVAAARSVDIFNADGLPELRSRFRGNAWAVHGALPSVLAGRA